MPDDAFAVNEDKQGHATDQEHHHLGKKDDSSKPAFKPASKQPAPAQVRGIPAPGPVPERSGGAHDQEHAPGEPAPVVVEPANAETRLVRVTRYLASWAGPLDPLPAIDVVRWATNLIGTFIDGRAAAGGAPVFRMHIGLPVVVLTDHTSAKFFLGSPSADLDREDFKRFGPLGVPATLVKQAMPSLVASDANGHKLDRAYTVALMHSRFGHVEDALRQSQQMVYDDFLPALLRHPDRYTIGDVATKFAGQFMFKWLLDTTPPSLKAMTTYIPDVVSDLQTSNWLGGLLGTVACTLKLAASHSKALSEEGLDIIRHSDLYEPYRKMALALEYTTDDLDRWLQFLIQFNGIAGIGLPLASAIAMLSEQRSTLDDLRREIGNDPLRFDTVDRYPLLESFAYEWQRFFLRPTIIFKKAMKDLQVPSTGGPLYQVRKGDLICAALPLCLRDDAVFGEAAGQFNARRFLDNPSLKSQVFTFGFVDAAHDPAPQTARFGCALYSAGVGLALFKILIGTWIQRVDWECDQEISFAGKYTGDYGPLTAKFKSVKRRQPQH